MDTRGGEGELAGQVAVVTGSAVNIGRAIVRALAAAGASVVVNYRSSADGARETVELVQRAGGRAVACQADVTDPGDVERLFEVAEQSLGGLDILVNNANVRSFRPLSELTLEEFRAAVRPTLEGSFLCVKAAVPLMLARGGGTIINMGGGSAHSGVAHRLHVAAAKGGLAAMTGSLAVELAPHNITVNCIVPGRVDTPRPHRDPGVAPIHASPMGRSARQEEIADLARYLCGPGCRFMTGQMLHVNGAHFITIA